MNIINFPSPFIAQSSVGETLHNKITSEYTEQVQIDLSHDNKKNFVDDSEFKRFSSKANNYESEIWNTDGLSDWNARLTTEIRKSIQKLVEVQQFPKALVGTNIDKCWWEYYEPFGYRSAVNYPEFDFTGIYVVDCQQKDVLNFVSPLTNTTSRMVHSPEINNGDILLFPSNLVITSKTFTRKSLLLYFNIDCKWVDHGYMTRRQLEGQEQSGMFVSSKKSLKGMRDDRLNNPDQYFRG